MTRCAWGALPSGKRRKTERKSHSARSCCWWTARNFRCSNCARWKLRPRIRVVKPMPLRDDLLNPISAENPAGESIRYAPVFDKIKEARRQEDDAPQGDWTYERK